MPPAADALHMQAMALIRLRDMNEALLHTYVYAELGLSD
jgi:hypothetical protein